ncbi:MAG: PilW family protein [Planctomycetota bacterium]|jgi:hypothetical protein
MGRTPHHARRRQQAGITFIEVLFGLVLVAMVAYISLMITSTAGGAVSSTVSSTWVDQRAHRLVEQLTRELMQAGEETVVTMPIPPLGSSTLSYQRAESISGGSVVWSTMRRIELVPDPTDPPNGMDDNGNGLTDEHLVRLVTNAGLPSETVTVLARHVAGLLEGETENVLDDNDNGLIDERGLCFEWRDDVLVIRASLQGVDVKGVVTTRTVETSVRVRN